MQEMDSNEPKSLRDKAARARALQDASAGRRELAVKIAGAAFVLLAVFAIIGAAVFVRFSGGSDSQGTVVEPNSSAALPAGVLGPDSEFPYAVPYGTAPATAPILQLWEDFQCPACAALEEINGQGIKGLADSGEVQLLLRPTTFLDANLGNTSSAEATSAWGCAIDAGKTAEYAEIVFANQPEEGVGYTREDLIGFGSAAGIVDMDSFSRCVNDGTYLVWAANSTAEFFSAEIPGTPYGVLDGSLVEGSKLADPVVLGGLIAEARGA